MGSRVGVARAFSPGPSGQRDPTTSGYGLPFAACTTCHPSSSRRSANDVRTSLWSSMISTLGMVGMFIRRRAICGRRSGARGRGDHARSRPSRDGSSARAEDPYGSRAPSTAPSCHPEPGPSTLDSRGRVRRLSHRLVVGRVCARRSVFCDCASQSSCDSLGRMCHRRWSTATARFAVVRKDLCSRRGARALRSGGSRRDSGANSSARPEDSYSHFAASYAARWRFPTLQSAFTTASSWRQSG